MRGTRIGQYEIIQLLGRGGMGEVFQARDLRLGRLVAVKLLTAQAPDLDERLLAEAQATAGCRHDNIVVIYEIGAHEGRPYMVLEYLEGQTLRQWASEYAELSRAPVPRARTLELLLPVVRALVCAHDAGIVHRDLKPENVMLTRAGGIKVLDFGVAKRVPALERDPGAHDTMVASGGSSVAGTRAYMSPEQVAHRAVDHRADVWAVGVMLFELAVGVHPMVHASASSAVYTDDDSTPQPSACACMPELGPLAQIIDRCLIRDPAHRTASARALLAELEALVPGRRPMPVGDNSNPFPGLAAFQEEDASRFFGRDRDIEQVVAELRSRPLVVVIGPSGTGKSSLVRAGVIPALKRSGEGWDAHIVRPGREPLAALAALASSDPDGSVLAQLRDRPGSLACRLRTHATSKRRRVVLFVDQLEELYTLGAPPEERLRFLACLIAIADDAASPLRVLVSMRSDFLDRLSEDRRLGAALTRCLVLLPPMDRDGMREALLRPVEANEHCFESAALLDRMVDAVAGAPGALPLLQFTVTRLWERRDRSRRLLTEASYEQLGGVAGALATHANVVLAGLSPAQQSVARAVLVRLVTLERTRAPASMAELRALQQPPNLVDDVVQHLVAMRVVVIEPGVDGEDPTVELVHESLIECWPTLARWLDDHHHDAAMLARLRSAARDWERSGHAAGLLWTGEVARATRVWQQRYKGELTSAEQRYLAAVLASADRRNRMRSRLLWTTVSTAISVALTMAWLAWKEREAHREAIALASAEAEVAMRARDATRMAVIRAMPDDPTTQLALLREIEEVRAPPHGAVEEARRLLQERCAAVVLTSPDVVNAAAFSPDGQRIASASDDGTVWLWNSDGSGAPVALRGHTDKVASVAFSPDGRRIASASLDQTIRLWNLDGSGEPLVLRGHTHDINSVVFSPDGSQIASSSHDRTVRVWNVDGSGAPRILRGHDHAVVSVAFSPDGERIASSSLDKTVRIWSALDGAERLVLRGHGDRVTSVRFSPDGQRVASGSNDKTVRVWNADGNGEPVVLSGHGKAVLSVAFSPDGGRVASASVDKTVRIWSMDGGAEPLVLRGHDERVTSVAFSLDGQRILSASIDRTVRVWRAAYSEPSVLHGHDDKVGTVAFSPDGRRVASGSDDKTVRVWNLDDNGKASVLRGHGGAVESVEFSPDGQWIASASYDHTVHVWRANGAGNPVVLRGHDDVVRSVAFSPDSRRLVSASEDKTVRVWSVGDWHELVVLHGHGATVDSAVFSPDGRRIVSAAWDWTARVWNADGTGAPVVLLGHRGSLRSALFSPDGQRIVTASLDHTVRVWSLDGRGDPVVLQGHSGWVFWAEFSPDGRHIVSASRDKTIRIWPADGAGEPVILVGHDLPVLQARFSPDGRRIVSASLDNDVRIWHELAPISLDDPRLWTTTNYCMPVARRIELLRMSAEQARRDRARCLERVERAATPRVPAVSRTSAIHAAAQ